MHIYDRRMNGWICCGWERSGETCSRWFVRCIVVEGFVHAGELMRGQRRTHHVSPQQADSFLVIAFRRSIDA